MTTYHAMRQLPETAGYKKGDVLFLCGELFGRGYANGIIEEARGRGMTIIGATVGRRDADGLLRPLNEEELATAEANLGGRIINIPLEAGFDLEPGAEGKTVVEHLKGVKPDGWDVVQLDFAGIEKARKSGAERFRSNLDRCAAELDRLVPKGANLLIVHSMAGGIPRARIFMPILNRVIKSKGDRYIPSEQFWNSDLGRLCQISFNEVTADTFSYLIEATAPLSERIAAENGRVSAVAYGYHGTEVLVGGEPRWQSYNPYLQGWAKIRLEEAAAAARMKGIRATVYNCPEIQTNSSALFLGVEISLYPFLSAVEREAGSAAAASLRASCAALLKDDCSVEKMLARADEYLASPILSPFGNRDLWPMHSTREQMEYMLDSSAELLEMNRSPKEIVCAVLSGAVFKGVGRLMLDGSWGSDSPVCWLNHDVIAKVK